MTYAQSRAARAMLSLAGCALAIAAMMLLVAASTVHAAEPSGYGELTRFGETGDGAGQINELGAHAIGVDPTDNSVYVLDEPEERSNKRMLRLQKFTANGAGGYSLKASVEFIHAAPEVEGAEPTVDGVAVDPTGKRVYLLAVDVRKKSLAHASRTPSGEGVLVASTLYAFSTVESGSSLVAAPGTKPGGIVIGAGEGELAAQSETPGQALLQPRGITVDPETQEVIILAHEDKGTEKEDNVKGANDHYVLQRIESTGGLGHRYVDTTNVLKEQGEFTFTPSPHSPIVVSAAGKEHVYVGYGGLAEIPLDFTSNTAPKLLAPSKNPSTGIEQGISSSPEGGRLTAAPDGTVYGANDSGIANEEPGSEGQGRAGVVALSGADGSEIGWSGGQQLHQAEPKETCVISPLIYTLSARIAAGSGGKLFVLGPEFLLRKVEGEPEIVINPETGEEEEIPTFESLPGPFFPPVIEFGPGGTGCPQASVTAPVAKVNNIEVKGEETIKPGAEVTFESHVNQADALKVEWDFGDGSKETVSSDEYQSTSIKHKFTSEGTFNVTEKIYSDDLGAPSQTVYKEGRLTTPTITVSHTVLVGKRPPRAQFTGPGSINVAEAASFESHSTDPNGAGGLPLEYVWNFGDGTPETSPTTTTTTSHSYAVAGTYTVTLTVTDHLGLKGSFSKPITVNASSPPPVSSPPPSVSPPPPPPPPPPNSGSGGGVLSYKVSLAATSLSVSPKGAVVLKVDCGGQSSCTGRVTLRTLTAVSAGAGKRKAILTLASGSFTISGSQVKALTLHLSTKALSLLKRSHTLRARATILAHDYAGTSHSTALVVTLRPARHH